MKMYILFFFIPHFFSCVVLLFFFWFATAFFHFSFCVCVFFPIPFLHLRSVSLLLLWVFLLFLLLLLFGKCSFFFLFPRVLTFYRAIVLRACWGSICFRCLSVLLFFWLVGLFFPVFVCFFVCVFLYRLFLFFFCIFFVRCSGVGREELTSHLPRVSAAPGAPVYGCLWRRCAAWLNGEAKRARATWAGCEEEALRGEGGNNKPKRRRCLQPKKKKKQKRVGGKETKS